jgi:hypothetical protein
MIFVIKKTNWMLQGQFYNLVEAKNWIAQSTHKEEDFYITQDLNMKYISRIVYVDGKCVYNNKQFWTVGVYKDQILDNYEEHEVLDFMGLPVDKYRFEVELNTNLTRLNSIDGIAGEVEYNITVGNEFISLFREECIFTDFQTITPLEIAQKLAPIISLVQTGSFREAKQVLQTIENDQFLTPARVQKYIDMMDSADVIEYATAEDFYYTASDDV